MPINVLVTAVGGGVLAFAIQQLELIGLAIFFLPIFLSAYAFRLYVRRTQEQMDRLEELVELRTQDLAEANESLAELNEQKDAFLAVLTHDMRSPLTNIHGYASLMRDNPQFETGQRTQMLDVILRNERALLEIVNNILDIEHLESGAPILLDRENFNLTSVLGELVESHEAQAIEKQIQLEYEAGAQPIFVHADKQKCTRILQNLISNALKYTPEQGRVTVRAHMNGRYAKIDVEDTGYGIPQDELPHIFDRFSRVDKHKNVAVGTGLGLAIVKSLVEAHGGEICVQSEEGVGSTFTVKLPA
jgi:signal transduction histidine kinase